MIRAACLVALLASACYATRPPTTSLEVVHEAPPDAVPVGVESKIWGDDSPECPAPPERIREQAMRWGANFLVVKAKVVTVLVGAHKGDRVALCKAQGYAAR